METHEHKGKQQRRTDEERGEDKDLNTQEVIIW